MTEELHYIQFEQGQHRRAKTRFAILCVCIIVSMVAVIYKIPRARPPSGRGLWAVTPKVNPTPLALVTCLPNAVAKCKLKLTQCRVGCANYKQPWTPWCRKTCGPKLAACCEAAGCGRVAERYSASRLINRCIPFSAPPWAHQRRSVTQALAIQRPLSDMPLPAPLCANDGRLPGAPPEDIFTLDTVTKRMPKILQSTLETLPLELKNNQALRDKIHELQRQMETGARLELLESTGPWVGAETWNLHLQEYLDRSETWHSAPWWVVENYMYKRLLQELARSGAPNCDPFEAQKKDAMQVSVGAFETSVRPLLELIASAEDTPPSSSQRRSALEAAVIRSLWGNQADLSLTAGKVIGSSSSGQIITDQTATVLDMLQQTAGRPIVIVLDNHGLEVLCDLLLVDAILRLTDVPFVSLHVKDAPVFVSDVTDVDIPGILDWLEDHEELLATRLRTSIAEKRLRVVPSDFYTSARAFWELPDDLRESYELAAFVILKGDANYRRLLGDLHWPYDIDFSAYTQSFWPSPGLVSLRTMKSGVALGIPAQAQEEAKLARPDDWLTSGVYGQVLASSQD